MPGLRVFKMWGLRYALYIFRWMVLAVPGAWFLTKIQTLFPGVYIPMIVSQGILGAAVYFVDKRILKG